MAAVPHDLTVPVGASGEHLAAWHWPAGGRRRGERAPVVVMAHGLGGTRGMRLPAYAERFAAAGYACLVIDYRHFGASTGEPRQVLDVATQLEDWQAAVAHARTLPGVDPERVVLWGTSFSGGHVLGVAAADPRVAAVVAQCPFTDGLASARVAPPRSTARLLPYAVRDLLAARRGRPPVLVPAAGPPGSAALMTAPDALPGYDALRRDARERGGAEVEDRVAARFALAITRYFPGRRARHVRCPLFVAVCREDSVAPAATTRRHVARAPHVEIRDYDHGHFAIYLGQAFEEVVADQLDFLRRHVPAV